MTPIRELESIGQALDEISWAWLSDTYPRLAEAVATEVDRGVDPAAIRRFVMGKTQRLELALRCEQAARFLAQGGEP